MRIDIVTALPDIVGGPLQHSILRRAVDQGRVDIRVHDIRAHAIDKHRQIDDYPYGGGAGMVLKPEPIFACIASLEREAEAQGQSIDDIIYLTPDGAVLEQGTVNELSLKRWIVLLAGHYKGVDQRVRDALVTREISIGDYVLSGGELPALVLVDALVRLVPGVLGDAASALEDSFQDGLLGAPVYTRPASYNQMEVPPVLRSGDHVLIERWRDSERVRITRERRPELLDD